MTPLILMSLTTAIVVTLFVSWVLISDHRPKKPQ